MTTSLQLLEDGEVDSDSSPVERNPKQKKVNDTTITLDGSTDSSIFLLDTEPDNCTENQPENKREPSPSDKPVKGVDMASRLSLPEDDKNVNSPLADEEDVTSESGKSSKRKKSARSSIGFVLGAVIPESITEFKTLPHFDKWTVDVTDHILFENLPDALGTWDNLRTVVKKVRCKMDDLHAED